MRLLRLRSRTTSTSTAPKICPHSMATQCWKIHSQLDHKISSSGSCIRLSNRSECSCISLRGSPFRLRTCSSSGWMTERRSSTRPCMSLSSSGTSCSSGQGARNTSPRYGLFRHWKRRLGEWQSSTTSSKESCASASPHKSPNRSRWM